MGLRFLAFCWALFFVVIGVARVHLDRERLNFSSASSKTESPKNLRDQILGNLLKDRLEGLHYGHKKVNAELVEFSSRSTCMWKMICKYILY